MPPDPPCRVLVIEDESLIGMLVEDTLSRAGCAVATAATGPEALALARAAAAPPDVVVLDLVLPGGMSGLALLRRLRALARRRLPAVVTTGTTPTAAERLALDQAGGGPPVALLLKPYDPAALLAEVLAAARPTPAAR